MASQSAVLDGIDRQILHGLQLAPRVSFARLAAVLGVSEQTAARRYQRLRTLGVVRVFGWPDPARVPDTSLWTLRINCRPGTTAATANALARRTDTMWVSIGAGGAELTCQVAIPQSSSAGESLLHHLPRATNVLTFTAQQMLHRFAGRGEVDWIVAGGEHLAPEQRAELLGGPDGGNGPAGSGHGQPPADGSGAQVGPEDKPLMTALARDGRASYAALAAATGWSQRQVAHRVAALTASRAIFFDIDAAVGPIGFRAVANLWFTVAPAHLESVGNRLADHPELAFTAAMTGTTNLLASAACTDAEALYRYLTTKVAAIEEVRSVETVPLLARVKQTFSLVENEMLKDPAA
jgi:DNA-binding Lrp family transcriptional regulator